MTETKHAAIDPFDQDFDARDTNGDSDETFGSPIDCAEVAARHLLMHALGDLHWKRLPGLYVLVAPGDAWVPALGRIAPHVFCHQACRGAERPASVGLKPEIYVEELRAPSGRNLADETSVAVQNGLMRGQVVLLITGSVFNVPQALRNSADRVVLVPHLDRRCLKSILSEIDPKPCRLNFRDIDIAAITPASLRFAYRPGTSANAMLKRLKALMQPPPGDAVRLEDLHGVDEVRRWAADLKSDLGAWRQGKIPWNGLSRGLLLAGPPGTGKTSLAAAIANSAGTAFISASYAAWQRSGAGHLGDVLRAMAASFNEARERAPSILLIDELDSLGARGGSGRRDDWWRTIINALLEQMDGTIGNEGVILIAATNHPELIDPAILRSGRLEDRIDLEPPDVASLARIYADQLKDQLDATIDLDRIALMSAGSTGADIIRICKTARRSARHDGGLVTDQHLLAALAGHECDPDEHELFRTAVHEAGHALVALEFPELRLDNVTIVGRGNSAGRAAISMSETSGLTSATLDALLLALLGGRAAEEIMFGDISAGAGGAESSDLGRATRIAATAELSLGMRNQGLIWYPRISAEKLAELFARRPDIERTVQRRLDNAYARARDLIEGRASTLRRLADRLRAQKTMTAEEVVALVDDSVATAPGSRGLPPLADAAEAPCLR